MDDRDTALDASLPPAEFESSITSLLCRLLPSWSSYPPSSLSFHRVSGGITNALMRVEPPAGAPAVLVRVFGSGSELLIDRAGEGALTAWLGSVGVGPAVLGAFRNGRVEAWIPRARPLEPPEMGSRAPLDVPRLIARELARFHGLQAPGGGGGGAVLWEKLGAWARLAFVGDAVGCARWEAELVALSAALPSPRNAHGEALLRALGEGGGPLGRARAEGAALAFRAAFCHNDLLSGNLLLLAEEAPPRVAFIDFEYGATNYAGFDIGNHWCEHVGFLPYDLARLPGAAAQGHFLRAYVAALGLRPPTAARYGGGAEAAAAAAAEGGEDAVSAAFWEELRARCELFMLASHLWWGLWATAQAAHNAHAEFDYALYARERLAAYEAHKQRLLG
jgi:ethanolamine kinase